MGRMMADEREHADDFHAPVPRGHYESSEWDRRWNELQRGLAKMPPEAVEMFYAMRERMSDLERDSRNFVPRAELERMMDRRADSRLARVGIDVEHPHETAAQFSWLMGLKRGFRGFAVLMFGSTIGLIFTLLGSYISSHWGK